MHRMQWKPEERDSNIDFSGKDIHELPLEGYTSIHQLKESETNAPAENMA